MSEPWYKDGLRFQCTECGDCCTGDPGYVWVSDAELADIAAFRGETLAEVRGLWTKSTRRGLSLREKENGDCVFLGKNKGCTIYPVRPRSAAPGPFGRATSLPRSIGGIPARSARAPDKGH